MSLPFGRKFHVAVPFRGCGAGGLPLSGKCGAKARAEGEPPLAINASVLPEYLVKRREPAHPLAALFPLQANA